MSAASKSAFLFLVVLAVCSETTSSSRSQCCELDDLWLAFPFPPVPGPSGPLEALVEPSFSWVPFGVSALGLGLAAVRVVLGLFSPLPWSEPPLRALFFFSSYLALSSLYACWNVGACLASVPSDMVEMPLLPLPLLADPLAVGDREQGLICSTEYLPSLMLVVALVFETAPLPVAAAGTTATARSGPDRRHPHPIPGTTRSRADPGRRPGTTTQATTTATTPPRSARRSAVPGPRASPTRTTRRT